MSDELTDKDRLDFIGSGAGQAFLQKWAGGSKKAITWKAPLSREAIDKAMQEGGATPPPTDSEMLDHIEECGLPESHCPEPVSYPAHTEWKVGDKEYDTLRDALRAEMKEENDE